MPEEGNADANIQQQPDTVLATGTTVTPREMEVAFAHPAPVCNRVLLTMMPLGGRLSFLEIGPDGQPQFRSAVYMGLDGLLSLQDLIRSLVQPPVAPPEENEDVPQR